MLYRIGEMAEILGITKCGVRFLERKGLLHSEREEGNGYRYYGHRNLADMHVIRGYCADGFTLEEIMSLMAREEGEQVLAAMREKDAALEEEILRLSQQRETLRLHEKTVEGALAMVGKRRIQQEGAVCFLPAEEDHSPADRNRLRRLQKDWMQAAPNVRVSRLAMDRNGRPVRSLGVSTDLKQAEQLGLCGPGTIILPEGLCAVTFFWTKTEDETAYRDFYDWVIAQGWHPAEDMLREVYLPSTREGKRSYLNKLRMPVGKIQ